MGMWHHENEVSSVGACSDMGMTCVAIIVKSKREKK